MYKSKNKDGTLNISGAKILLLRKQLSPKTSQKKFSSMLQLAGLDIDKNAIQRIECGKRFITDIELKTIAHVLGTTSDFLLELTEENHID